MVCVTQKYTEVQLEQYNSKPTNCTSVPLHKSFAKPIQGVMLPTVSSQSWDRAEKYFLSRTKMSHMCWFLKCLSYHTALIWWLFLQDNTHFAKRKKRRKWSTSAVDYSINETNTRNYSRTYFYICVCYLPSTSLSQVGYMARALEVSKITVNLCNVAYSLSFVHLLGCLMIAE